MLPGTACCTAVPAQATLHIALNRLLWALPAVVVHGHRTIGVSVFCIFLYVIGIPASVLGIMHYGHKNDKLKDSEWLEELPAHVD